MDVKGSMQRSGNQNSPQEIARANLKELNKEAQNAKVVERFAAALGREDMARNFLSSVVSVAQMNTSLATADRNSILQSAMIIAITGLNILPALGHACIVPYSVRMPDGSYRKLAQPQIMANGYKELAFRTGMLKRLNRGPLYEGDILNIHPITGELTLNPEPHPREKVCGYFAYCMTVGGFEHTVYWESSKIIAHAMAYAPNYRKDNSIWKTNFPAMAEKTVLRELFKKYLPISAPTVSGMPRTPEERLQRAMVYDMSVPQAFDPDIEKGPEYPPESDDTDGMTAEEIVAKIIEQENDGNKASV